MAKQKYRSSRAKILLSTGIACCLLIIFGFFYLYAGIAYSREDTASTTLVTQEITASPTVTSSQSNSQGDQSSLLPNILLSLGSAILGALIGGALASWGSIVAAKKQIDYLYKQERYQRIYNEKQQQIVTMNSLWTEIRENLDLAEYNNKNATWISSFFRTKNWEIHKGNISVLSDPLQEELIMFYTQINLYNDKLAIYRSLPDFFSQGNWLVEPLKTENIEVLDAGYKVRADLPKEYPQVVEELSKQ